MKHPLITKQPEQILIDVEKYLHNVTHRIDHQICGGYLYLTIDYDDFKPRREVRDYIENIADNCIVDKIDRGYSDKYIVEACNAIEQNEKLLMRLPEGTLQEVNIWMLLEKHLQYRSFKRAPVERYSDLELAKDEE